MNCQREGNCTVSWDMIRDQAEMEVDGVCVCVCERSYVCLCVGLMYCFEWAAWRMSGTTRLVNSCIWMYLSCRYVEVKRQRKRQRGGLRKKQGWQKRIAKELRDSINFLSLMWDSVAFSYFYLWLSPSNLTPSLCLSVDTPSSASVVSPSVMKALISPASTP